MVAQGCNTDYHSSCIILRVIPCDFTYPPLNPFMCSLKAMTNNSTRPSGKEKKKKKKHLSPLYMILYLPYIVYYNHLHKLPQQAAYVHRIIAQQFSNVKVEAIYEEASSVAKVLRLQLWISFVPNTKL